MPKNVKLRRPFLIAIVSLIIILVIWGIYWIVAKNRAVTPRAGAVAVGVATVRMEDAPLQINALGTVDSTYTATVRSRWMANSSGFFPGRPAGQGRQLWPELDPRRSND